MTALNWIAKENQPVTAPNSPALTVVADPKTLTPRQLA